MSFEAVQKGYGAHVWASRVWSPTASTTAEQPLFSLPGRAALDLSASCEKSYGGEHQTHTVRVYAAGGDTRELLATSHLRNNYRGRAVSLRGVMAPRLDVTIEVKDPGLRTPWRFRCDSWGSEPSDALPALFERSGGVNASRASTPQVSDVPASLAYLEAFRIAPSSAAWLQLYDTSAIDNPTFNAGTLRMVWPIYQDKVLFQPPQALQLSRGGVLLISSSPDAFGNTGESFWAQWSTQPTVHAASWRLAPTP